jgi:DNA-directed RNA polymerase specialized sigma24 family protein
VERAAAQPARADALQALTDDQRTKLVADARLRARGTSLDFEDLLQGAYERWMASDKAVTCTLETYSFLRGAIRSIASNERRHASTIRRVQGVRATAAEGELDPAETVADPAAASQENSLVLNQLYDLCANDPEVQTLLMLQDDGAGRAEVLQELGWDVTRYETVQKRKRKMVARLINEGKI